MTTEDKQRLAILLHRYENLLSITMRALKKQNALETINGESGTYAEGVKEKLDL